MNNEWLKNLKVGDKVVVESRNGFRITAVSKITKTMIMTSSSYGIGNEVINRYRISDGREVGNTNPWHTPYLVELKAEHLYKIKHEKLCVNFLKIDPKKLDVSQLEAIFEMLSIKQGGILPEKEQG